MVEMCETKKFFICKHCGNIVGMIFDSGAPLVCCGENMAELKPNTTEAAVEKHLPVIEVTGSRVGVRVGSVPHPMTQAHHIAWVYLQTNLGGQRRCLDATGEPAAVFALAEGEEVIAAYAYCNLHGLWMTAL